MVSAANKQSQVTLTPLLNLLNRRMPDRLVRWCGRVGGLTAAPYPDSNVVKPLSLCRCTRDFLERRFRRGLKTPAVPVFFWWAIRGSNPGHPD